MPTKKVVRKPIEKLSKKENVMIIEDSSSEEESSEEETYEIPAPPPKLKRERTQKQIESTKKMLETRMRNKQAKLDAVKKEPTEKPPQEAIAVDSDDIPLTLRQYKALMNSQKKPVPRKKVERKKKPISKEIPPSPKPQFLFV